MYLTESTNLLGWRAQEYAKNLSTKKIQIICTTLQYMKLKFFDRD